jgi:hypothetical protein
MSDQRVLARGELEGVGESVRGWRYRRRERR